MEVRRMISEKKLREMLIEDLRNETFGECLDDVEIVELNDVNFEAVASYSAEVLGKEVMFNIIVKGKLVNEDEYEVEDLYIEL